MRKFKALDLCCGGGGASQGLNLAGFSVTGCDITPQAYYYHDFILGDALIQDLSSYDFVWASPPCQHFTKYNNTRTTSPQNYQNLIPQVRKKLQAWDGPWIIENVVGAPLNDPILLCGSMFGLDVRRHRLFESNIPLLALPCDHTVWQKNRFPGGRSVERGGSSRVLCRATVEIGTWDIPIETQKRAMGIDWILNVRVLSEAIPPAYSHFLGRQVLDWLSTHARQ